MKDFVKTLGLGIAWGASCMAGMFVWDKVLKDKVETFIDNHKK